MNQSEFDFESPTKARTSDPATSHKAAASAKVAESHAVVRAVLSSAPVPLTSFEIAAEVSERCSSMISVARNTVGNVPVIN